MPTVAPAATAIAPPPVINRRMSSPLRLHPIPYVGARFQRAPPGGLKGRPYDDLSTYAKRQQHVAADAVAQFRISRRHEEHAAGDDRTGGVDVAAFCRDAVHGLELARGVELPQR